MRKPNYYNKVLSILQQLHNDHPTYNIGRHLSTAFSEYGDIWGCTDRELLFALEKYQAELELDVHHTSNDIDDIIKQGMDLDNILKEEDDDENN